MNDNQRMQKDRARSEAEHHRDNARVNGWHEDKSRANGGISEAQQHYSEDYDRVPSKTESVLKSVASIATMGLSDRAERNSETKQRNEYVDKYNKEHHIKPEKR